MVLVFQLMKQMLDNSSLPEFQKGPGVFDGESTRKSRLHRIGRLEMVVGFREFPDAPGTEDLLPFYQRVKTRPAIARKKKGDKISCQGHGWDGDKRLTAKEMKLMAIFALFYRYDETRYEVGYELARAI